MRSPYFWVNDYNLDVLRSKCDRLEKENERLKKAGSVLLKWVYESGVAYDNKEVEQALKVIEESYKNNKI